MVQDPTQFDVLVMPNLYGDILRYSLYRIQPINRTVRLVFPKML